ncbi:unnamed protein product [Adineta steineri]|uniref:SAM domain-containing protein n=1 Tax=Adineta steineri TaxID=433720 RepID=A0A814AJ83_9BILA|nr:unnamed protein product [Adineta steineri]CAF0913351.1 unnamed protein product [Adineta steineri]CAF0917052.1 unnamed protein product [Adineta steineri]CAF0997429.1 unnamed protein product [Adineta steineri]CAF1216906.1 unnamed protein product [Adineta steineri]
MEVITLARPSKATSTAPCFWTNSEVLQWMKNSLPELFNKYGGFFKSHGIRGRTLFMLNDNLLLEMGINNAQDRAQYRIEIAKLKIKSDLLTLKNTHHKGNIRFLEENPISELSPNDTI